MKKYFALLLFFFIPLTAGAARLDVSADPLLVGVGDTVQVSLSVTSDIPVNTFAGSLTYSGNLIPESVSDGNSIINMWLVRPSLPTQPMHIPFSGFTPGGYTGTGGRLFRVVFRVTLPGQATVGVTGLRVLRNDGAGTEEPVTLIPLELSLAPHAQGGFSEPSDVNPPESFIPLVGSDPGLFQGKYYIAFTAVDKDSGIDHYEVAERRLVWPLPLSWKTAESPYVLTDQGRASDIYVKAVDRAGHFRVASVGRAHFLRPREWLALGALIVFLFVLTRRRKRF